MEKTSRVEFIELAKEQRKLRIENAELKLQVEELTKKLSDSSGLTYGNPSSIRRFPNDYYKMSPEQKRLADEEFYFITGNPDNRNKNTEHLYYMSEVTFPETLDDKGLYEMYTDVVERFKTLHGEKYYYLPFNYVNNKMSIKISCREHGIFEETISRHYQGRGCPKCKDEPIEDEIILVPLPEPIEIVVEEPIQVEEVPEVADDELSPDFKDFLKILTNINK